ncbi:MAG: hypothetical protein J6T15_05045 [Bacilli bacterium]|nr:hypothetical protein [Bacilli bacterium]
MEDKYNILITYSGDGDFKFIVRRIGEIIISKTRPVYIYNVTADVVNDLRPLRRLLLNVSIGSKPDGAYKVYDFDNYTNMPKAFVGQRPNFVEHAPITNAEISSILKSGTKGPEVIEEVKPQVQGTTKEEEKAPEVKVEKPKAKSTKAKPKKKKK